MMGFMEYFSVSMIHLTLGLSQADREIMDFKLVGITVSDKGRKIVEGNQNEFILSLLKNFVLN